MSEENIVLAWPEWRVEARLGKGSYGVVYKAVRRDSMIESYSAVKVISIPGDDSEVDTLRAEGLTNAETKEYFRGIVEEFVSEIQLMESIKGMPNIVSVEDYKIVEKENGIGWDISIRMELLTPFNNYAQSKALTERDVIKLGIDICSALEICEIRNIIHRDIKPENIFVNDFGCFKLGDFGIARKLENATGGMSQKGTYNYMAPEVMNGSKYDSRVDIYSLGLVLYRLLNGNRLPFIDSDAQLLNFAARKMAVERRLSGEQIPAPCNASPEMADLILRACAYNPSGRFARATEMKNALMSVANGTYVIDTADVDSTVRVCRAQPSLDETVGVRRPLRTEPEKMAATPSVREDAVAASGKAESLSAPKNRKKSLAILPIIFGLLVIIGLAVGCALMLGGSNGGDETDSTQALDTQQDGIYSALESSRVGDTVKFGLYEQDGDRSNGNEDIEWIVLEKTDDRILVISKYGLDYRKYNAKFTEVTVTWETCSLRKWLNGDFMNAAFADEEKAMIPTVTVSADKNPSYSTNPGKATEDKVFLLSITEVNKYFSSDSARQCKPTAYAIANRATPDPEGNCSWWLRSPGDKSYFAIVSNLGGVFEHGFFYMDYVVVRPAMWINLDK